MKRVIFAFLLGALGLSIFAFVQPAQAKVAIGSRSEEIKAIQEILKSDPEIYPEGYVTGYFGPLTKMAIKRLQKKCGIPETGALDEATERCIYPIEYKIKVVFPNGGEKLNRNEVQTIKWEIIGPSEKEKYLFWPKASIDLFKRSTGSQSKSVFVRHLAVVNLFDQSYSWRITNDIPNGSDYVIRISTGRGIVPIWIQEKTKVPTEIKAEKIWPISPPIEPKPIKPMTIWDESDGTFEITGEIKPSPVSPNLEEIITTLTKIVEELQKLINALKSIR